jgi:cytochrome b6-f complex iron-sulfur subunit
MTEEAAAELQVEAPVSLPLSRREFLYYVWGASMAVLLAGAGGATIWFILPRFREGEFGGVFTLPVSEIPPADSPPKEFAAGRFWLVNIGAGSLNDSRQPTDYPIDNGVRAIFKVCTHLGCLYKWNDANDRFECPCHGSKFLKTGTRIDGPARRNLDVFMMEVLDSQGNVLAQTEPSMDSNEGAPLEIPSNAASIRVDTGRRVSGAVNSKPGGGL